MKWMVVLSELQVVCCLCALKFWDLMEGRSCLRAVCRIPASLSFWEGIKVAPYNHHGLSAEINSRVTSAIILLYASIDFWTLKAVSLIEFYTKTWLWEAVALLNMQTLIESCFFINDSSAARCVAVVSSLVTVENSWEVGLLYPTW